MRTWTADAWLTGQPEDVMDRLTDPSAISRWSPVCFDVLDLDDERLTAGSRARVRGSLAGRGLEFDVFVHEASDARLRLSANGPIKLSVDYRLSPIDCGTEVQAAITIAGDGIRGRLLAGATEAVLATGALDLALARIDADLELTLA